MSRIMCGHCFRPATVAIYRRPMWRKLLGRPAARAARHICTTCLDRYRNGSLR